RSRSFASSCSRRRVRSWRLLSPSLHKADVVVWFPTDSKPPPAEVTGWFDDWLSYSYDDDYRGLPQEKVLIYVGRHYDAEELYWASTQASAPAALKQEFAKRLSSAKAKSAAGPSATPGEVAEWFTLEKASPTKRVDKFSGELAGQADASKATVQHNAVVKPGAGLVPLLLDDNGRPLVSEAVFDLGSDDWGQHESRLIVVENGSFLLNAPLVNRENRQLAGGLIAHLGAEGKEVVFLEADSAPTISEKDPEFATPNGLQFFRVWPIGAVLGQAAALGLVFAMSLFPIFGVPRRLQKPSLTDFGKHVGALARLLAATRDRAYARELLGKYFSEVKKE
ncbi:MAG: hypothetical protein KDA37_13760, partial [Planctomycetales bacterium]|nr:hypothetical protein [Planctomycetales bacterium]